MLFRSFSSRTEYDWGCALLHPPVKAELARRVAALDPERDWAVAEIPMLFESGVPDWVTATVFVTASRDVRAERCRARGWDDAERSLGHTCGIKLVNVDEATKTRIHSVYVSVALKHGNSR